jgi:pimeloyl-ACP methyl ester carboxylesterase
MFRPARALLALAVAASVLAGAPLAAGAEETCAHQSPERQMSDEGIRLTAELGLASGRYALPDTEAPTQLVVLMHGYGNDSCSWRNHLRAVAARGAVAVAMDYTGQDPDTQRGWRVLEGAEDSIAAAQRFMADYPSIEQVYVLGVSMGGNASGMAVAHPDAVRTDGSPLFDGWVAVEGVHNLAEEYLIARGVAPVNQTGANASADIEEEAGGAIEEQPQSYAHLTNVWRVQEMAGLGAAVIVHGADDGTVPSNQSREMAAALRGVGVATELYTVAGRGDGEDGSTGTGIVAAPVWSGAGLGTYTSPTAGHGWEGSDTHLVIRTGFAQLWAMMGGKRVGPYREFVVHGEGLTVSVP